MYTSVQNLYDLILHKPNKLNEAAFIWCKNY